VAVVALDGGNPPKSGSILVDISVADVNDNAPVFDNDTYEVRTIHFRAFKSNPNISPQIHMQRAKYMY